MRWPDSVPSAERFRLSVAGELRRCLNCGRPRWFHILPLRHRKQFLRLPAEDAALHCTNFRGSDYGQVPTRNETQGNPRTDRPSANRQGRRRHNAKMAHGKGSRTRATGVPRRPN